MKKIVAVMIIIAGVLMLSACGGSGDKSAAPASKNPGDVYRVVTVDESGAPVEGVMVQFCSDQMFQMVSLHSSLRKVPILYMFMMYRKAMLRMKLSTLHLRPTET